MIFALPALSVRTFDWPVFLPTRCNLLLVPREHEQLPQAAARVERSAEREAHGAIPDHRSTGDCGWERSDDARRSRWADYRASGRHSGIRLRSGVLRARTWKNAGGIKPDGEK